MTDDDTNVPQEQLRGLRVLVVDNDIKMRELHESLLREWNCQPFIAEGEGDALHNDAIAKAYAHRCQLALVDLRTRDDTNPRDWSGLELAERLAPTTVLIVSGLGDRSTVKDLLKTSNVYGIVVKAVTVALKTENVYNFVAKEAGPEVLAEAMVAAVQELAIGSFRVKVIWSHGLSSAEIGRQIFHDRLGELDDEAEEAISRLFAKNKRVALSLIADRTDISARLSAPRGTSCVFIANVDTYGARYVIKFSRKERIQREVENFERYVTKLPGNYYPEKVGEAMLWSVGAVAYRFIGANGTYGSGGLQSFTTYYYTSDNVIDIIVPLKHFFDSDNWGYWYESDVVLLKVSLFEAYDTIWKNQLTQVLPDWSKQAKQLTFPFHSLAYKFINPTRWLHDHINDIQFVEQSRVAITHGDLHGDNLFVSQHHAWPIDFERTGLGPILRDFVELIHDILTRITIIDEYHLPTQYALAVALCIPMQPREAMLLPIEVRTNPKAYKTFQVIRELLQIAATATRYHDRRELLWGLMLNSLFASTLLNTNDPRYTSTLLLASVICSRLEHWKPRGWPTPDMPTVDFYIPEQHTPDSDDCNHLRELYSTNMRRLNALEIQAAQYGINTDVAISNEIKKLKKEQMELMQKIEAQHC